ncbi:MAG: hypothetical protein EB137_05840 [Actinobacteria bacterium]|nr:hypothetical protein [Actinomycetota bacterium]
MKAPLTATYGHGTENDFVILFDPDDENNLSSKQTAAICNRQSGIGADGLASAFLELNASPPLVGRMMTLSLSPRIK